MRKALSTCLRCFIIVGLTNLIHHSLIGSSEGEDRGNVFVTWNVFEVDKCASIWLITRFIEPNADIQFIDKGKIPEHGIAFDMPEAEFKRTVNMSTYESFLHHYKLTDPRLVKIGKIVHDVEINTWERKIYPESQSALEIMNTILMSTSDSKEIIDRSCSYFDELYEKTIP